MCVISAGVVPTSVWTPTYQAGGQKAERGNAFSIGVGDIFVVPNVDNGFLLQLGAERVVFVLHWPSDRGAQMRGARELWTAWEEREWREEQMA